MHPEIALIAAVARNGVIGRDGALPWHLPGDLRHFRALTLGHRVVMGRRTWESLGRPLPGRDNVVVSRSPRPATSDSNVRWAASLPDALALPSAPSGSLSPVFVIGGAALYAEALPQASALFLTEIDAEFEGDVYFPRFDRAAFVEVSRMPGQPAAADASSPAYAFAHYRRR